MFTPVYLDHNATTPLAPSVREAMLPWLGGRFGNASSRHEYGRAARTAIDEARAQVAALIGAQPDLFAENVLAELRGLCTAPRPMNAPRGEKRDSPAP